MERKENRYDVFYFPLVKGWLHRITRIVRGLRRGATSKGSKRLWPGMGEA